jgi:hypothetical protein
MRRWCGIKKNRQMAGGFDTPSGLPIATFALRPAAEDLEVPYIKLGTILTNRAAFGKARDDIHDSQFECREQCAAPESHRFIDGPRRRRLVPQAGIGA